MPHLLRQRERAADLPMPVPWFIGACALLLLADVADGPLRMTFSGRDSYAGRSVLTWCNATKCGMFIAVPSLYLIA